MKRSGRISVFMTLVAIGVFVGFAPVSAVAPGCCDNTPPQCTAWSLCFDNGWCEGVNRCVAEANNCHWIQYCP
jgi:hypothetical protein